MSNFKIFLLVIAVTGVVVLLNPMPTTPLEKQAQVEQAAVASAEREAAISAYPETILADQAGISLAGKTMYGFFIDSLNFDIETHDLIFAGHEFKYANNDDATVWTYTGVEKGETATITLSDKEALSLVVKNSKGKVIARKTLDPVKIKAAYNKSEAEYQAERGKLILSQLRDSGSFTVHATKCPRGKTIVAVRNGEGFGSQVVVFIKEKKVYVANNRRFTDDQGTEWTEMDNDIYTNEFATKCPEDTKLSAAFDNALRN